MKKEHWVGKEKMIPKKPEDDAQERKERKD